MNVEANQDYDEVEAALFIKSKLLGEQNTSVTTEIIYQILEYEMQYLMAKGLAVPIDEDQANV